MQNVAVAGVGRLGGALAIALARQGYRVSELILRRRHDLAPVLALIDPAPAVSVAGTTPIDADLVIIATQDGSIAEAAGEIAGRVTGRPVVLHTSGSLSSDVLSGLRALGLAVGSMHPLASVSEPVRGAERFNGSFFCVEGDPVAVQAAETVVRDLGGKSFSIEPRLKALYHAAAVTACGHLVALLDAAFEMLGKCGLDEETAKQVLLPLVETTILNLRGQTPSGALTGTFARADVGTFERHLGAIDATVSAGIREIYLMLGERSLELALGQGADRAAVEEIRRKILLAKSKSGC